MTNKIKNFLDIRKHLIFTVKIILLMVAIFLMIISIIVFTLPNVGQISFFQKIGITHWQTVLVVWFVYISSIILTTYKCKGDKYIISRSFAFVFVGGTAYALLTHFSQGEWIAKEGDPWLMILTEIFMGSMIAIVPFFVFFTIIRTLTNSKRNKVSTNHLVKSFFSIWLMPFLAITIAILLFPLIQKIPAFKMPHKPDDDTPITTLPMIFNYAIPKSLAIFFTDERILGIVSLALIVGIILIAFYGVNAKHAENVVDAFVTPQKWVSKIIFYLSWMLPMVIATRMTALFDIKHLLDMFGSIAVFFGIFMAGWAIVVLVEWFIIIATMKNKSMKHFFNFTRRYVLITFIKHAAAVHMEDTIRESRKLGVSKHVADLTSGISTSMGQSCCGGFYPAFIALVTKSMIMQSQGQTLASLGIGSIISFILIMYVVIMITNLGMTGVPGADTAVILSVLAGIGLPSIYFGVVFAVDGVINHIRGIANAFGFVAANNIAERVVNSKKEQAKHINEKSYEESDKKITDMFDYSTTTDTIKKVPKRRKTNSDIKENKKVIKKE